MSVEDYFMSHGTQLSPTVERWFQSWWDDDPEVKRWRTQLVKETGMMPDPNDIGYDYRGAFASGVGPDKNLHWPSKAGGQWLKNPGFHPTAYKERSGAS